MRRGILDYQLHHSNRACLVMQMGLYLCSPRGDVVDAGFERCRVADHFVQHADNIWELWPRIPVFLPAVQHQLVQHYRTVHGSWQSEVLLYGIYHLGHSRGGKSWKRD